MMRKLGRAVLVWAAAAWGLSAGAAQLMIEDVDVRNLSVGAEIVVPVVAAGLSPGNFAGFQFSVSYATGILQFLSAERGSLIDMIDPTWAAADYAPDLWALEARANQGQVAVAGMILLDGVSVTAGNLGQLDSARIPASDGILVNLHFRLLQKAAAPLDLDGDNALDTLVLTDPLAPNSTPTVATPGNPVPGGVIIAGLPNWWQLDYFDTTGVDETADPDNDGVANLSEYQTDTDPRTPDVRLRLDAGWNLFSLPVVPDDPAVDAVMDAANSEPIDDDRGARATETVQVGPVWTLIQTANGYSFTHADQLDALTAYWVYVPESVYLFVTGTVPPRANLSLHRGWNLVGPRVDRPPRAVANRDLPCFGWNTETNRYEIRALLSRGVGYWLYCTYTSAEINLWDAP